MTQGPEQKDVAVIDDPIQALEVQAQQYLQIHERNMLMTYIRAGRHPLAPDTVGALYQLFLNGSDCGEIHRLNKALPYEAILWARIKYGWDKKREDYIVELQEKIREKVMQSQLQTTELMADLLTATARKHGDKIKKFIQTGEEADLGEALSIDNLGQLLKIAEGLQKITGQDRVTKFETKNTQRIEVGIGQGGTMDQPLSDEAAAEILAVVAAEKRRLRGSDKK